MAELLFSGVDPGPHCVNVASVVATVDGGVVSKLAIHELEEVRVGDYTGDIFHGWASGLLKYTSSPERIELLVVEAMEVHRGSYERGKNKQRTPSKSLLPTLAAETAFVTLARVGGVDLLLRSAREMRASVIGAGAGDVEIRAYLKQVLAGSSKVGTHYRDALLAALYGVQRRCKLGPALRDALDSAKRDYTRMVLAKRASRR